MSKKPEEFDPYDAMIEEFEKTPVKKTETGKKLTTTACVNEIVNGIMNVIANTSGDAIAELMMPKLIEEAKKQIGIIPPRIEIVYDGQAKVVAGVQHEKFEEILKMVTLDIPVYLTGKAGTGKNVICQQVAEALGLQFYFTNCVTQEYKLTGFIDANGKYQETQFYKAFTEGGLFFLDEMDASVPETLVILNAALANRYFDFPIGKVTAHPDFRVIAAGNTLGTGADLNYTGRYSLDRASLDRFAIVKVDYSHKIEMNMADDNRELVEFVHAFRLATERAGVECLCSYRTISRIAKLETVFDDLGEILEVALIKGLDTDTMSGIKQQIQNIGNMGTNKYARAMSRM